MPTFPAITNRTHREEEHHDENSHIEHVSLLPPLDYDEERQSFIKLDPPGFFIRHPPAPHLLKSFITPDDDLFQTIHMGAAVVDLSAWRLTVTGLVKRPFTLDLQTLKLFPATTITSFHECYGSPLKPPLEPLWRVGNVTWTGVRLSTILQLAEPLNSARYIWSEGLDRGTFATFQADRYQKDLPISKAMSEELLLAYEINGEPLSKERGGPVRLIVPGYFGTNSTKWLCTLRVEGERAKDTIFTTKFYNHEGDVERPVWEVEVNSMITRPEPEEIVVGQQVRVEGWAWDEVGVKGVEISVDGGRNWVEAKVEERVEFSWQKYEISLTLTKGKWTVMARARARDGKMQPLEGHRNRCHMVEFEVD
ncbi:Sulfite oxidase [Pseudocercospora fuligena]|uniref:Sulfite oxidase n=1 Tax=Pseudocercospora fuligena TaxID=685502 RepID=A0A8H6RIT1_9PEZI|nr:Sulfite oxidase [Pseudocercospora fuligena]